MCLDATELHEAGSYAFVAKRGMQIIADVGECSFVQNEAPHSVVVTRMHKCKRETYVLCIVHIHWWSCEYLHISKLLVFHISYILSEHTLNQGPGKRRSGQGVD